MVTWILRGIVLLWAAFFLLLGVRGFISPQVFTETFGVTGDARGMNTVRADLSALFIVASLSAAIGVLSPAWRGAMLVPAALFGTALLARAVGLASGDPAVPAIHQSMVVEAVTVVLMIASWRHFRQQSR